MSLNYLEWIGSKDLTEFLKLKPEGRYVEEVFPGFTTLNGAYQRELERMSRAFEEHVKDTTLTRPFLYLILGPPGAGKSYLIEQLIKRLKKDSSGSQEGGAKEEPQPIVFQAANLSEMHGPEELHGLYLNIKRNRDNGFFTVTLLDEFDVRWAEGSAIKYLINPIYDGKYWDGHEFQKFGKCAFFFAGSYLQDRDTLMKVHMTLTGVNLGKFLNDMYLESRKRYDDEAMREIAAVQEYCYTYQKWRAEVDPRTDAIFYLRNLEKIRDFLSRIAGNVIEILDVSQPLAVTQNEFVIQVGQSSQPTARLRIEDVVSYLERQEEIERKYLSVGPPGRVWVEYKNVLLCERLLRVLDAFKKRFKEYRPAGKKLERLRVERRLLNYLTVTPLINGMRSLEQLVNMLKPDGDLIKQNIFEQAKIAMVVHNAQKFSDPLRVWDMLEENNPDIRGIMQHNKTALDPYVSVPL